MYVLPTYDEIFDSCRSSALSKFNHSTNRLIAKIAVTVPQSQYTMDEAVGLALLTKDFQKILIDGELPEPIPPTWDQLELRTPNRQAD